ncbi:hypothetical protein CDD81_3340 [Ophiocordyceps australis]|uniref:G-protein coupled receptors family 2 profile 2 domain-containing protein n=1 Tax=Ophiocordyceps australis TaxID=1399860 RepID=A0A2C5XXN4_9HYPO|nr:hypothetical protein CDD81_3340 [Ophiocordyceps australis]
MGRSSMSQPPANMTSGPVASSLPISEHLSQGQINVLVTLERIGGSVSLVAILFIFVAYALLPRVRNVQNTFIVFASVSNVGASIASIIALDGLRAGKETALCQTQSFLFEMFMQSDPWWSLAMSINVFLVFYFRTSPDSVRRWWWIYCIICYGGPGIIALTLLLIKNHERGLIYGEATIWCWIDPKWDSIRIYTYYMLIWICIVGSFVCYILVGYHVFRSRNQLRSFPASKNREHGHHHERAGTDIASRCQGVFGTVTTEVQVVHTGPPLAEPKKVHVSSTGQVSFDSTSSPERRQPTTGRAQCYSSVTSPGLTSRHIRILAKLLPPLRRVMAPLTRAANKFVIDDPIKRAYLRTSLLFALSVLVTWIPSSLNRIHGWLDGKSPYEYHVATASVLPLQGLWNFLIFFITSWAVIKKGLRPSGPSLPGAADPSLQRTRDDGLGTTVDRTARDDLRSDSDFDDIESGTMGSDVELRRVGGCSGSGSSDDQHPQAKTSMSLSI